MGMKQPIELDTGWALATDTLDESFPLASGSHRDAADYLVQQGHLLVIRADGTCTGLARPGQLVEFDGEAQAPEAIVLEEDGLQVEIEPRARRGAVAANALEHRVQLMAVLAPL